MTEKPIYVIRPSEMPSYTPAHAHPDLEQAVYILEGEAMANIDGVAHHVKAGEMMYFPAHVFHDIKILSEKIKMLVIYAPPYDENPQKIIKIDKAATPT
jgi:quercetin dioxygenase-like cupin family protein